MKPILLAEHAFACIANVLILFLTIFPFALLYLSQLKKKRRNKNQITWHQRATSGGHCIKCCR